MSREARRLRITWGEQTWEQGSTEGDLSAAEAFFVESLIGPGDGLLAGGRFDPTASFASLLAFVAVLHARGTGKSVPEAWVDLADVPAGQIVAALTIELTPEIADDLRG